VVRGERNCKRSRPDVKGHKVLTSSGTSNKSEDGRGYAPLIGTMVGIFEGGGWGVRDLNGGGPEQLQISHHENARSKNCEKRKGKKKEGGARS